MGLSLKLLGEFALRNGNGAALSLPTRKTRALLGYLAVNADRPQPRERLMALLWSDRSERQARQSLNQALLSIRKLGDGDGVAVLESDGEQVTLWGNAVDCDVQRLRSLTEDDPAKAASLYEGPFLDGLSVPDRAFEEWLLTTRSELHTLACDALTAATQSSEDPDEAIGCAKRVVALDPLREDAHRRLMQLLHQSGDRAAALRQYQACAEILHRELQVEPDAATKALFEAIRRDGATTEPAVAAAAIGGATSQSLEEPSPHTTEALARTFQRSRQWFIAGVTAAILLVIGGGITAWLEPWSKPNESAPWQRPALPLPDKPSIAVLPFTNLSGDPEQEYFSDGITGDLITDLSKVSGLFVISRNASFAYKGRAVDPRTVGRELGVRYLLEGTVRRSGGRVRINAQFVDARTGGHIWAERFDHKLEDVFTLQDEVTRKIVFALSVTLKPAEEQRRSRKAKIDPEAYDLFLRGLERLRRYTPETNVESRKFFREATTVDPRFARAIAAIAFSHTIDVVLGVTADRERTLRLAERYATAALELDDRIPAVHLALSSVHQRLKHFEESVRIARRIIEIDPNYVDGHTRLGGALTHAGRPEEALKPLLTAGRLDPRRPFFYLTSLARAYFMLGRYDEAARVLEEALEKNPAFIDTHRWLAASYAHLGRKEQAEWEAAEVLALQPDFSLRKERTRYALKRKEDMERYIEGLRKAGLPE